MTDAGIIPTRLSGSTSGVSGRARRAVLGARDDEAAEEVRARVSWCSLVEPGDAVAGMLVDRLGAVRALEVVRGGVPADSIVAEVLYGAPPDPTPDDTDPADWLLAPDMVQPLDEDTDTARERRRLRSAIQAGLERWAPRLATSGADAALDAAAAVGARLVVPGDPGWPSGLDALDAHAPLVLWVRGDPAALEGSAVAVVGSRANTPYGEDVTASIVSGLADAGQTVVSGGAYGIDAVAHRVALAAGVPTVAVLAGGIDRLYPAGNTELLRRVIEQGAVIAECPCGVVPSRWRFLQRNRLIAAAAAATVVVEAGRRSGALNTAHHAVALARPVGAVPGPVTSSSSAGCHELIRTQRAELVVGAADVLTMIGAHSPTSPSAETERSDGAREHEDPRLLRILDALGSVRGVPTAEVARRVGIGMTEAQDALALAELEERVERTPGGWRIRGGTRR